MDKKLLDYLLLIFAAFLFGLKAIADKQVALSTDSKLLATTISSLVSALFIAGVLLYRRRGDLGFMPATRSQWLQMISVGSIASGIAIWLTFVGLGESSATFAALNQGVAVLSTVLLATLVLKEKLPKSFYFALPIMIAGTYLVSVGEFKFTSIKNGDLLILGAAALIGVSNVVAKQVMQQIPSQQVVIMRFVFGALTSLLIGLVTFETIQFSGLGWMVASGIVGGSFVLLLYEGIKRVGASIASSLIMFSPVFAAILAWVFLDETLNAVQFFGMGLVLAGGVAISLKR